MLRRLAVMTKFIPSEKWDDTVRLSHHQPAAGLRYMQEGVPLHAMRVRGCTSMHSGCAYTAHKLLASSGSNVKEVLNCFE